MLIAAATPRSHNPSRRHFRGFSTLLGLYRQRRSLADMDPQRLADVGLTRDEANEEANRPIWDVPSHWRC